MLRPKPLRIILETSLYLAFHVQSISKPVNCQCAQNSSTSCRLDHSSPCGQTPPSLTHSEIRSQPTPIFSPCFLTVCCPHSSQNDPFQSGPCPISAQSQLPDLIPGKGPSRSPNWPSRFSRSTSLCLADLNPYHDPSRSFHSSLGVFLDVPQSSHTFHKLRGNTFPDRTRNKSNSGLWLSDWQPRGPGNSEGSQTQATLRTRARSSSLRLRRPEIKSQVHPAIKLWLGPYLEVSLLEDPTWLDKWARKYRSEEKDNLKKTQRKHRAGIWQSFC